MQPNIIPAKLAEILLMHIPLMMSTDSPQCFLAGILTGSRGATSVAGGSKNINLFWHPEVHKHRDYATVAEIEFKTNKDTLGNGPDYARRMVGY